MKALVLALPLLAASACHTQPCITPPPMSTEEQNSIAASIAAQLVQIPVGGSLSASYSDIVKKTYDTLTENDKALYLFLLAIDCYLKEGKVGEAIAKDMADIVKTKWAQKEAGPAIPTARFDFRALSHKIDSRSPDLAPKIHEVLKKVGLE